MAGAAGGYQLVYALLSQRAHRPRGNKEDGCKGRFREGRFKSQALLACMAYVDLNPIRAGLSETLEGSDYPSIQERIRGYVPIREGQPEAEERPTLPTEPTTSISIEPDGEQENGTLSVAATPLREFTGTLGETESGLPFPFSDYLELVDWTGRAIRADKRGFIPADVKGVKGVRHDSNARLIKQHSAGELPWPAFPAMSSQANRSTLSNAATIGR